MAQPLRDPWLIAVWPGMGSVALGAGSYLVEHLDTEKLVELEAREHFDIEKVEVKAGLAQPGRVPKSTFYAWRNPKAGGHDVIIFVGEAQPSGRGYEFCQKLLDHAAELGARRVFTFAAMATPMHPSANARVFAVANDASILDEVSDIENVSLLREGEISGMNGVLLAAAAERALPGLCLLGELPFFAISVPNPKASGAVLKVFGELLGMQIDLAELEGHAHAVERGLIEWLERINRAASQSRGEDESEEGFTLPTFAKETETAGGKADEGGATAADKGGEGASKLSRSDQRRIEMLFARAKEDRAKALELKQELDRLGVFKRYEDRFLDLFKSGG